MTLEELIAKLHKLPPEAMDKPVMMSCAAWGLHMLAFDFVDEWIAFIGSVEFDSKNATTFLHALLDPTEQAG